MNPVSLEQLVAAVHGKPVGFDRADVQFDRIGTDSRTIEPGDLFWALEGEYCDGHRFVDDAQSQGAAACVVDRQRSATEVGPHIAVDETQVALTEFAGWYRRQQSARVVGVTGSVGKTTTRAMIHAALSGGLRGTQSPRNFNNHVGVPLTLLEIERRHQFAVVEFGASAVGEIRSLAEIAQPEIGVVTAIAPAHLDGFGSEENIVAAKAELIESLPETGLAVLNGDDARVRGMADRAACRVLFVGERAHNDLQAVNAWSANERLFVQTDDFEFEVPIAGRHHVTAVLAAIAVAREFGLDDETIQAGLRTFAAQPGRCQVKRMGAWTVIDDTYNASPRSMHAACCVLHDWSTDGKRVLAVGDMLELGSMTAAFHRELGRKAAEMNIERIVACGQYAEQVVLGAVRAGMRPWHTFASDDLHDVANVLEEWLTPGDVLLVKGSRAMRMERIVEGLQSANTTKFKGASSPARAGACV